MPHLGDVPISSLTGHVTLTDLLTLSDGNALYQPVSGTLGKLSVLDPGSNANLALVAKADGSGFEFRPNSASVAWGNVNGTLSAQSDLQAALNAKASFVATRTALAALSTGTGSAYLTESGRAGLFVWDSTDNSANVTADALFQGIYVPPVSDTTGASGAWVRKFDSTIQVKWFGAKGDGITDDTLAMNAASAMLVRQGGGSIALEPKTYLVGTQLPFNGLTGQFYSYSPPEYHPSDYAAAAIYVTGCTKPVIIEGRGAKLVYPNGYKYGSFDPTTGVRYDPTLPFNNPDYRGKMLDGMVRCENNTATVTIRDLELDGNQANAVLGGFYDDAGRQIPGTGVWAYGNDNIVLENVNAHDHPLDGIIVAYTGLTLNDGRKSAVLSNCQFVQNCRQGLSWVGGNGLVAINSKFNRTGRGLFESAPGAGVDIEAEASICRNGHFISCEFVDNVGTGIQNGGGDVADVQFTDCLFVGTTSHAIWPSAPRMSFNGCKVVGSTINTYTSTNPGDAAQFHDCLFTADTTQSPTGSVYTYGGYLVNLGSGDQNVLFDNCRLTTGGNTSTLVCYTNGQAIFRNTSVHQDDITAGHYSYLRGYWHGINTLDGLFDFNGTNTTQNYGHLTYNGTVYDYAPQYNTLTPPSGTLSITGGLQVNGAVGIQNENFTIGKTDYSGPSNQIYYYTGGAYTLQFFYSKQASGTITQDGQFTAVGADFDTPGFRVAGRGGVNIGSISTYNLCSFLDGAITARVPLGISGAAGSARTLSFQTNGGTRWAMGADSTAESGGSAGSNFYLDRYDDAGGFASRVLSIARSTGGVTFNSTVGASNLAGTNTGDQTITLTGDVTGTGGGSFAATISSNAVSYAKMQQVTAARLVGNPTGSLANASEISLAGGLAFSGSTLTAAGALTPTSVVSTGAVTSSSATAGVGYSTGAGGTVTQITSRTTGVTLNKVCGTITLLSAAGSATWSTFTVTNSTVAATDTVEIVQASGANLYNVIVTKVAAGSFNVSVSAVSGTATEAPTFNFVVTKSVTA